MRLFGWFRSNPDIASQLEEARLERLRAREVKRVSSKRLESSLQRFGQTIDRAFEELADPPHTRPNGH